MTLHLYNIFLQDAATRDPPQDATQANVQLAGLLEQGFVANKVATESIDLTVRGQWHLADPLPEKFATELRSLAASNYSGVPLWDTDAKDPKQAYYQVSTVDVNPDHQSQRQIYQYVFGLNEAGSHESHWRAVRTGAETVSTNLATGPDGLIAIDGRADKVRWFDPANGTEAATVQNTETGDYATVDFYDPTEPSFNEPTLLFELPFSREWEADVNTYDDDLADREIELLTGRYDGGFQYDTAQYDTQNYGGRDSKTVLRWIHVYHAGYEFKGRPVVDTGRLRVRFDESAGEIVAWKYDGRGWAAVDIDHSDYDLFDADIEQVRPADVRVFSEWEKTDGSIDSAILSFQRGMDEVVVRVPENESSVDTDLESLLSPIASDVTTDPMPAQDLIRRDEVK